MDVAPRRARDIAREARAAGIRGTDTPTLDGVARRRLQLWIVGTALLIAVSIGVALLATMPSTAGTSASPVLRIAIVALPLAFGIYAIEKELRLRRLTALLTEHRVLMVEAEHRIDALALLLEAGKSMNSVLELPVVLKTILRSATDVLGGESGSIMLLESPEELITVMSHGTEARGPRRVYLGTDIAGRVAETRTPMLVEVPERSEDDSTDAPTRSGVCVPLAARGILFGVLDVVAPRGRSYTDYELNVASLLAENAACAIANARLYETERIRGDRAELATEFRTLHVIGAS